MFTAAFLGNRAPSFTISIHPPFKMLNGTEPDMRLLRVIGARAFAHMETFTKKLDLNAVEGRLVGYISNSKSCRVYDLATRCIMESKKVVFIETPSRLLPPSLEKTPPQLLRQGVDGHNYILTTNFCGTFPTSLRCGTPCLELPSITSLRAGF